MNILLVDDEKKFVVMLAKRLELRGFQVSFVNTGMDAVQLVKTGEKFDIAVLDVKMPGIGGIELRRELHRRDPDMKFIFLTGHGSDNDYSIGAGEATQYLPKPIKIDVFVETLLKVAGND
jgi:CheY-like chemotaxis protein